MDRLGLATEGVEPDFVEISGDKLLVPFWREAPGAIVEAFASNVDIVAVQHTVDEAGRDVARGQLRGGRTNPIEQSGRILDIVAKQFVQQVLQAVARQLRDAFSIVEKGEALEIAN